MSEAFSKVPKDFVVDDLVRRGDFLPLLLRRYVEESIISLVPLSASDIKIAEKTIIGTSDVDDWLASKGWSRHDLLIAASRDLALSKFAHQQFSPGLEESFLATRGGRDEIVYSLLRVRNLGLARELYLRIAEGELSFPEAAREFGEGPEARHQGLIGPIRLSNLHPQPLVDALRGLQAGELAKPLSLGEWHLILRLEHFAPARLDDEMRSDLLNEQLEAFLDERVKRLQAGKPVEELQFDCEVSEQSESPSPDASDLI